MPECKFSQLACSVRKLFAFTLSYIVTAYSRSSQPGLQRPAIFSRRFQLSQLDWWAAYIYPWSGGEGGRGENRKNKKDVGTRRNI